MLRRDDSLETFTEIRGYHIRTVTVRLILGRAKFEKKTAGKRSGNWGSGKERSETLIKLHQWHDKQLRNFMHEALDE